MIQVAFHLLSAVSAQLILAKRYMYIAHNAWASEALVNLRKRYVSSTITVHAANL